MHIYLTVQSEGVSLFLNPTGQSEDISLFLKPTPQSECPYLKHGSRLQAVEME